VHLTLYAVQNRDGQWFRAKGRGGYGETWVDDIKAARTYTRIGPAKAAVTFFHKRWPEYGAPYIVKLHVTRVERVDQTERAGKAVQRLKEKDARAARFQARWELQRAREKLAQASAAIERLRKEGVE
jgi:hypothetical protein